MPILQLLVHPVFGVPILHRKEGFNKYKDCFVGTSLPSSEAFFTLLGSEGTSWLMQKTGWDRPTCVKFFQNLMDRKEIEEVNGDPEFKFGYFLYKFSVNYEKKPYST